MATLGPTKCEKQEPFLARGQVRWSLLLRTVARGDYASRVPPDETVRVLLEQAAGEAEGCPVCRQAWGDHNLPRARACSRSLEEALALAEHRLLSLSDSRKRTPDDVLPIRP